MNMAVDLQILHAAKPSSANEAGPASKRAVAGFGFWIFLLSDIVMFSALFATYAVLSDATAGGPGGGLLFHQGGIAIETVCLLASSYTCGLMSMAAHSRRRGMFHLGAIATFALGATFLGLELHAFALDVLPVALGRHERELPGQQEVPRIAVGDLHDLAAAPEIVHVLSKNDFHRWPLPNP